MMKYEPMTVLPYEFQRDWQAQLLHGHATEFGLFELVDIRRSLGAYEEQRITVRVVDENGLPLSNVPVAFAFSTADRFIIPEYALWSPPTQRAFVVPTMGSGEIQHIQGSAVHSGEPGGVSVYCWLPKYASDVVTGCGMLADHTGMVLTFRLRRSGVLSYDDRFGVIEQRLGGLESAIKALMS